MQNLLITDARANGWTQKYLKFNVNAECYAFKI